MSNKIIRLPEVKSKTGLSRSTIYLRMAGGTFPHAISLGERAVGWIDADIDRWIENRISKSKGVNHG